MLFQKIKLILHLYAFNSYHTAEILSFSSNNVSFPREKAIEAALEDTWAHVKSVATHRLVLLLLLHSVVKPLKQMSQCVNNARIQSDLAKDQFF